jgi:hypothetical protein
LLIFWMSLSPRLSADWAAWRSPFHNFMVTVIGTLAILLVGLTIAFLYGSRGGSPMASASNGK